MKALLRVNFIILFLSLLIVSCIFFTKFENIARSKVQSANYNNAVTFVNGFLIASEVMFGIQILLLFVGLPVAKQPFAIQILFQLLGLICYGFYVLLRMPYQTISYIWGVFCLIPFLFSIISVIYKSASYKKYSLVDYSADNPRKNIRPNQVKTEVL